MDKRTKGFVIAAALALIGGGIYLFHQRQALDAAYADEKHFAQQAANGADTNAIALKAGNPGNEAAWWQARAWQLKAQGFLAYKSCLTEYQAQREPIHRAKTECMRRLKN